MFKNFVIWTLCLMLLFSMTGSVFAQDNVLSDLADDFAVVGGGGLTDAPEVLRVSVADKASFSLEIFAVGDDGSVSFSLSVGTGEAAAGKTCEVPVMNGVVDADAVAAANDCDQLVYAAKWETTSVPADADVVRVGIAFRETNLLAERERTQDPFNFPVIWSGSYHSPLMMNFYGEDGASKFDLTKEGNLALSTVIRTKKTITIGFENYQDGVCSVMLDSVVEYDRYADVMNDDYRLDGSFSNGKLVNYGFADSTDPVHVARYEMDRCANAFVAGNIPAESANLLLSLSVPIVQVEYLTESGARGIWQDAILNFPEIHYDGVLK